MKTHVAVKVQFVVMILMWFSKAILTVGEEANPHQDFSCSFQNLYSLKETNIRDLVQMRRYRKYNAL